MSTDKAIQALIQYSQSVGLDVHYGDESEVNFFEGYNVKRKKGYITIKKHRNKTLTLYDLLHELGHYVCRKSWKEYQVKYPSLVGKRKYTHAYYIDSLREEYDAWDNGLIVAQVHGIKINKTHYKEYASHAIYTYVHHFGTKKRTNSGKRVTR
jgi:hypothetical protein